MSEQFKWINFYTEFATKLKSYHEDRKALIQKIQNVYASIGKTLPKLERDNQPVDIDPFTVFGLFNKGIAKDNRIAILEGIKTEFDVSAEVPNDFEGIPVLNNQKATFYQFIGDRNENDINHLWDVFDAALALTEKDGEANRISFSEAYNKVRSQKGIRWNITMGLYWIRPYQFINLDSRNRKFMKNPEYMSAAVVKEMAAMKEKEVPTAEKYLEVCDKCMAVIQSGEYQYKSYPELSYMAWRVSEEVNRSEEQEEEDATAEDAAKEEPIQQFKGYRNPFSAMLINSKNLIFHGAPGTGKTYLAKEIAADIISNGDIKNYSDLSEEQKQQVEFVQFHPNYDYTDFVEGLRPKVNDDGTMGFELRDGIFKKFVARARKNDEDSRKSKETIEKEESVQAAMEDFFLSIEPGMEPFETVKKSKFTITRVDERHINISIPGNAKTDKLALNIDEVRKMLESDKEFKQVKDVTDFFGKNYATQNYSYDFAIYKEIKKKNGGASKVKAKTTELKKYIFIIDEINRGEISKIFGELFFAIDPGYRGRAGEISTQYANLHDDPDEKFYIPENLYIIGTMNDIDRSVDSFDFAMRRRFRFVELKADEHLEMLAALENEELEAEAKRRMTALNKEIADVEDLNENYQIGASYFLKLKTLTFDQLWTDYLQPLLREYVQGMYDEDSIMNRFAKAYGYKKPAEDDADEAAQN